MKKIKDVVPYLIIEASCAAGMGGYMKPRSEFIHSVGGVQRHRFINSYSSSSLCMFRLFLCSADDNKLCFRASVYYAKINE